MLRSIVLSGVVAVSVTVLAAAAQTASPCGVGFTWNRGADWKFGTADGSSGGNPCKDSAGNAVWQAEYILNVPEGSDLDTSDGIAPWYTLPSSGLMVWDGHWSGGTWAKLYDNPPTASRKGIGHVPNNQSYNGDHYANVPLLRWKNPSAERITVSLTAASSSFSAVFGPYIPAGSKADVMIGWTDASDGDRIHLLYSATVVKTAAADALQSIPLPELDINALVLEPGDSIIFSVRSRTKTTGFNWGSIGFFDDVNITVVPGAADGISVELLDGTKVTGKPKLDQIGVNTAFGALKIPIADLVGFTPGMDSRPEVVERVGSLIAALASTNSQEREQAQKELVEMGPMLKPIVAERVNDQNVERRARVAQILKAYETWATGHPAAPKSSTVPTSRQDRVQTASFDIVGKITDKHFQIETDFGTFKIELSQVYKVRIARVRNAEKRTCNMAFELRDSSRVKGRLEQATIRVRLPHGEANLPISLVQTVVVQTDRGTVDVILKGGDHLKGIAEWPDKLALKTLFGTLIIPPGEVTRIEACAADAVLPHGLVLHYSFDEKSDKVSDCSGKGNHGAVSEAQYVRDGHSGGAYLLDGENDHITAPNSDSLEIRKEVTVAVWVKLASFGPGGYGNEQGYLVNKGDDLWWNPAFFLGYNKGSGSGAPRWPAKPGPFPAVFHVGNETGSQNGGGKTVTSETKLETGKWYHLAGTYDGAKVKIYINGKLEGEEPYAGLLRSDRAPVHLGGGKLFGTDWGNQFTANGTIDDVMIWARALSAEEVRRVHEQ